MNWQRKKSEFLEIFLQVFVVAFGIFLIVLPMILMYFTLWWLLGWFVTIPIAITLWEMVARYNNLSLFW
jgi:hypothetical protein